MHSQWEGGANLGNLSESKEGGAGFKDWAGLVQEQPISLQKKGVWSLLSVVAGEGGADARGTNPGGDGGGWREMH